MTLQAWVPAGKDELIVDVTGANPSNRVVANLRLRNGRSPAASASGAIGTLAQSWSDNSQSGHSNQTFGAMAAIAAGGQNVTASVTNSAQVQVGVNPNGDESHRIVVASPAWTGDYDGALRFAPAWPSRWDISGTVYVQGGSKVDVQVMGGTPTTAPIEAGTTQTMTVRNGVRTELWDCNGGNNQRWTRS